MVAAGSIATVAGQKTSAKMDSVSYGLGVLIASNLKNQGFDKLNTADFTKAVQDVLGGKTPAISAEQANGIIEKYMKDKSEAAAKPNIEAGKKFLDDNAKKEGVVTLPSGLQYQIIKQGTGPKPGPTDKVTTHYHGTLIDGTVFDSSVDRGEPATFGVNQVIKGWTEALQLMPEGSKWRLFVPYNLAYGERGAGGKIGPYATLIFEVELLKVEK